MGGAAKLPPETEGGARGELQAVQRVTSNAEVLHFACRKREFDGGLVIPNPGGYLGGDRGLGQVASATLPANRIAKISQGPAHPQQRSLALE
jgi:hypothetical protein